MKRLLVTAAIVTTVASLGTMTAIGSGAQPRTSAKSQLFVNGHPVAHWCNTNGITCAEPYQNWRNFSWFSQVRKEGVHIQEYIGHDEPSLLFYSHVAGSGNDNSYNLTLPSDPPTKPTQDGGGGTWNFQLHPAFWFGMAMCDNQSAPNR